MDDSKMIQNILTILMSCKNKVHKTKILCDVQKIVSTKILVSKTKGTRISY